ncbi:MAG: RNA-binding protein [Bacteroidales bacterium]
MNIYVGNLNYDLQESDLEQVFSEYGTVESVKIIKDRDTGRGKGFGFVIMPDDEEAAAAIQELNGQDVMGRSLRVNEARPPRN